MALVAMVVGAVLLAVPLLGWIGSGDVGTVSVDRPDEGLGREDPGNPIPAENAKPGDDGWRIGTEARSDLEGFADRTSYAPGDEATLYVSTVFDAYDVHVYRTGWYGGAGGRRVWSQTGIAGHEQDDIYRDPDTRMVEARWDPTLTIPIGRDWVTGAYLAKLEGPEGAASWVPFTVRERGRRAPIVFQASVTTWQAYNAWGGASLYNGITPDGGRSGALRAKVVSFDRPYGWGSGAGDFLGLEYPLLRWLEQHGYDVAYVTNIDTHADPSLLDGRKAFLSLGHDEYWSREMRDQVEDATSDGVNLAFFGANAIYRKIRLEESSLGPHRRQVNYRSVTGDALAAVDPDAATVEWRYAPISEPEDEILGAMYECNPVKGDVIVHDPLDWLFEGTDLEEGDVVEGMLGSEYDRVFRGGRHPEPLWVLFRSPLTCRGDRSVSDMTFARYASGAGVFNSATSRFLCVFEPGCIGADPDPRLQRLVRNLLDHYLGDLEVVDPTPRPFEVFRVEPAPRRDTSPTRTSPPRRRSTPRPQAPQDEPSPVEDSPQTPTPPRTPRPPQTAAPQTPEPTPEPRLRP